MSQTKAVKTRFLVVLEKGPISYGAFSPDVDGCVAVGKTSQETLERFQEALQGHLDLLAEDGDDVPEPTMTHAYVEVKLPAKTVGTTAPS